MMGKYVVIMRYLISTICIVLLLWGCDRTDDATAQPKMVRKKIVVPKEQTAKVRTNKPIRTAKTNHSTAHSKTVRKKVVAPKEQTAKVRTNKTIRTAQKNRLTVQPKMVRKKVVAPKKQTVGGSLDDSVRMAKKMKKVNRIEENTMAAETGKVQAKAKKPIAPETKTDRQTLVAKKITVTSTADAVTKLPAPKKPAVRPRSDFSKIELASVGDSVLTSDKLIAATSNVTPKTRTATIPEAYDATGKIDPFEPLFKEKPVSVKKKKSRKRIPQTPLERIDLSQIKLVGIIMASSGNRALVEESSGKGYVIKTGTYIGINSGKVVKIRKEKVVVEEEFEDVFGKVKLRQREIKLPKPPGEF